MMVYEGVHNGSRVTIEIEEGTSVADIYIEGVREEVLSFNDLGALIEAVRSLPPGVVRAVLGE